MFIKITPASLTSSPLEHGLPKEQGNEHINGNSEKKKVVWSLVLMLPAILLKNLITQSRIFYHVGFIQISFGPISLTEYFTDDQTTESLQMWLNMFKRSHTVIKQAKIYLKFCLKPEELYNPRFNCLKYLKVYCYT